MSYTEIKAVKGVRNDVAAERFATGDLLYAKNVDIDETGKILRRQGSVIQYPGAAHSAWNDKTQAFFVQGGSLHRFVAGGEPTAIAEVAGSRVVFASIDNSVYWSDGIASGVVKNGVNHKWGIKPPSPIVASQIGGNLQRGYYLCTMTFVNGEGIESGAPRSTAVNASGIALTDLEVSDDPTVQAKNIYISTCNGEIPLLVASIPNSQTELAITEMSQQTEPVGTQFMGPPPAGQVAGYYNGRAYIADGQYLWYSQAFEFELFDLRSGYLALSEDIQTFSAVSDGVFIGTTKKTLFLRGTGPDDFIQSVVSPVGTILGTELTVPAEFIGAEDTKGSQVIGTAVLWTSNEGVVLGMDGGAIRELTASRFVLPGNIAHGGALLKVRDGIPQYVVSIQTPLSP